MELPWKALLRTSLTEPNPAQSTGGVYFHVRHVGESAARYLCSTAAMVLQRRIFVGVFIGAGEGRRREVGDEGGEVEGDRCPGREWAR